MLLLCPALLSATHIHTHTHTPTQTQTPPLVAYSTADQLQTGSHHIQDENKWQLGLPASSHPKLLLAVPQIELMLSV